MSRNALVRALGIAMTSFIAAAALWAPAFWHWDASGFGDWQQFHHWWEIGVVSVRRFGEWPLWDPYHCGGVSQWGQPQAQNYGPLYLLFAVPFGTTIGHKLFIFVHHIIGWASTYVFARREERLTRAASFFGATVWCASGFYAWHAAGGHSTFLSFYYTPLLLLMWRRAQVDVRYCVPVALIMTEMLLEGAHYPVPFAVVILAFDSIARFRGSNRGPVVRTIVVAGGLTAFLGAVRWMPILLAMHRYPRPIEDTDKMTLAEVLEMLTSREHAWTWPGHPWVWAEYGTYVGYGVLGLAAIGVLAALATRRFSLIAGAGLFLLFAMGHHGPYWPATILHSLPFVSNLHLPSRWQVFFTLYLALLGAVGIHALDRGLSRVRFTRDADWFRPMIPWLVVLGVIVDLYVVSLSVTDRWNGPPVGVGPAEAHFHLISSYRYHDEYSNYPSRNLGTMECYDAVPWPKSRTLWSGDVPQVRFSNADGTTTGREGDVLTSFSRTNHTAFADVTLGSPGRIIFNQNHQQEWHSNVGHLVDDGETRLAVELPAGHHRVSIYFAPDDLPYSLITSGVGILLSLVLLTRRVHGVPRRLA